MEVWGNGLQTRSFLYIDECIEAVRRLMNSDFTEPVNIGSEEMISINEFAQMAIDISEKNIKIYNIEGKEFEAKYGFPTPLGVKGRNSDRSEEHTSELQSRRNLVCRLLLEKKNKRIIRCHSVI